MHKRLYYTRNLLKGINTFSSKQIQNDSQKSVVFLYSMTNILRKKIPLTLASKTTKKSNQASERLVQRKLNELLLLTKELIDNG